MRLARVLWFSRQRLSTAADWHGKVAKAEAERAERHSLCILRALITLWKQKDLKEGSNVFAGRSQKSFTARIVPRGAMNPRAWAAQQGREVGPAMTQHHQLAICGSPVGLLGKESA